MYASTGDERFKQRVDYIVGDLPNARAILRRRVFTQVICPRFPNRSLTASSKGKPVWAPWYTLHKIMAGLLDANRLCGNEQALAVAEKMADWVKFRVDRLSQEQMQKSLNTEHGGMNEVLANLYAVTGNTNYLAAVRRVQPRERFRSAGARRRQVERHSRQHADSKNHRRDAGI